MMQAFFRFSLLIALAFLIGGCAYFDELSRAKAYRPSKVIGEKIALNAVEMWIDTPSAKKVGGGKLHAVWLEQKGDTGASLLYLHGNAGNIYTNAKRINALYEAGFSVLAVDYRGFGKSDGDLPDEEAIYADTRAAWEKLKSVSPNSKKRIVYGYSLGGAAAIELAHASKEPDGVAVEGAFSSFLEVANTTMYRFLPLSCILTQKYPSMDRIKDIKAKKLIIHGLQDETVDPSMGKRLYEAASEPKSLLLIENGLHGNAFAVGAKEWRAKIRELGGL